jgi:hypothetical protein
MMTPEAAGAALAADPTFRLMSREEQEEEAARLLGGFNTPSDDPLDVALAIELAEAGEFAEALARERLAIAEQATGLEPCRLNADGPPCNGDQPIAGNGRCMTCGAQRRAETPATAPEAVPAPVAPPKPETAPTAAAAPILPGTEAPRLRHGVTSDPGASFLGRFKEATGATDRETSGMLGMSRATVQAYAAGRLPEKLTPQQVATIRADIADRLLLLADLDRDLAVAVGELD